MFLMKSESSLTLIDSNATEMFPGPETVKRTMLINDRIFILGWTVPLNVHEVCWNYIIELYTKIAS